MAESKSAGLTFARLDGDATGLGGAGIERHFVGVLNVAFELHCAFVFVDDVDDFPQQFRGGVVAGFGCELDRAAELARGGIVIAFPARLKSFLDRLRKFPLASVMRHPTVDHGRLRVVIGPDREDLCLGSFDLSIGATQNQAGAACNEPG